MPELVSGGAAVARVTVCRGVIDRMRGLLGRDALAADECIVITPCRSIHTVGMRFPIDVAFIDGDGSVLAVRPDIAPGRLRVAGPRGTRATVEAAAGALSRWGVAVGDRIDVVG